ncbi:hypothetical protein [Pseudomonas aeruginosa]|uniref:hypothetical protein n=1 Tax=Pseudomonas aeruginosa TaxID=287 RepID=UPI001FC9E986|nr:hypothetical protein [Pseudomonas aeruginosa]
MPLAKRLGRVIYCANPRQISRRATVDAAAGEPFAGKTGGVWSLPAAAGLTQGAKCSVLDGELVAAATADSVAFGKITEPTVDGFASAMLIQQ